MSERAVAPLQLLTKHNFDMRTVGYTDSPRFKFESVQSEGNQAQKTEQHASHTVKAPWVAGLGTIRKKQEKRARPRAVGREPGVSLYRTSPRFGATPTHRDTWMRWKACTRSRTLLG